LTIGVAMVFALLGGLILNLMPCVFPVLSLKILGFVQAAHHDAASIRRHGLVFGAGVLVSFWFLAGTLIALRAAGNELGWGFQLQSPTFVAGLALGLFVLALNLLGVFEMGGSLQTVAGRMDGHAGYRGSFASGVLATVLATPCTAPFMGTALGWALAQPAASSLAVFTALGAGMAAPYVVLSFAPRLLSRLPRPGAWMETFKQLMAFPLLATVVWLVWVLGQQTGNSGVASLLTALLSAGRAAWIFGRRAATGAGRLHALGTVSTVAAAAVSVMLVLAAAEPSSEPTAAGASEAATDSYGIRWIPYDAGVLADLREQGRRVFVDFTAAWCLTCKVNERITFGDADVRERLRELDVVTMKADWTDGDPAITRALESFGRSGVPLYVLYDGKAQPVVLPQVLGAGVFLEALAELEPATERLALRR
jgi:thiol:disulfide interchange protein